RGYGSGERPSQAIHGRGLRAPATTVNHLKAWLGIGLTVAVVVAAVAAPWLAPRDPLTTDFAASLRPPGTPGHPLGTDQLGRDLLARVLHGARLALFIGVCTVLITGVAGGLLGLVAGFVERWPSPVPCPFPAARPRSPSPLFPLPIRRSPGSGPP